LKPTDTGWVRCAFNFAGGAGADLDEPTAAALGYGMVEQENLLVIDFGGGTLDLSLIRLDGASKQAKETAGFILKWGEATG